MVAMLSAASMWFYVDQILVVYQREDAAVHNRPRGNLSDLYPRWYGARELLLHHRNPYGDDVTTEIQKGYYGRALDATRPDDPKDQEGFAYPVYVIFLLAPLIALPFSAVMGGFYWFLAIVTAASVWLWLRTLRWRLSMLEVITCILFTLGSFSAVQGIRLQQLSLLAAALIAASAAAAVEGYLFLGGALLALATIKPQLVWPLAAWLMIWAMSDLRARRRFVLGFVLVLALLLGGAELILPGWGQMFAHAIGRYHQYTQNQSVLEVLLNELLGSAKAGRIGGIVLSALAVLGCAGTLWKFRRVPAHSLGFAKGTALALGLTVLVVPMYAPYNQLLLVPAILLLVRERQEFSSHSLPRRLPYLIGIFFIAWQWVAALCLTLIDLFVSPAWARKAWQWPFYATLAMPILAFALIFSYARLTSIVQPEAVIK